MLHYRPTRLLTVILLVENAAILLLFFRMIRGMVSASIALIFWRPSISSKRRKAGSFALPLRMASKMEYRYF